jgi:ABC-type lipoprotein release transport system permease subunit
MDPYREVEQVLRRFLLLLILLAAGSALAAQEPPAILISRQLAAEEHLTVGDVVQLSSDGKGAGAQSFRIAGIYEPTPDPMRLGSVPREVRLHLPDLLALTRDPATPAGTEFVEAVNVKLVDPADAERFSRDLNGRLPGVFARLLPLPAPPVPSSSSNAFTSPSPSSRSLRRRYSYWR